MASQCVATRAVTRDRTGRTKGDVSGRGSGGHESSHPGRDGTDEGGHEWEGLRGVRGTEGRGAGIVPLLLSKWYTRIT